MELKENKNNKFLYFNNISYWRKLTAFFFFFMITSTLLSENLIEIGDKAVWSLTSVKPGNGVEKLRDDNLDTFWQSDGNEEFFFFKFKFSFKGLQPHKITIQFHKIVKIKEIAIYVDLKHDESYTPKEILIKGGYDLKDMKDILTYTISNPDGWQRINFENISKKESKKNKIQSKTFIVAT